MAKIHPAAHINSEQFSRAMDNLDHKIRLAFPFVADVFIDVTANHIQEALKSQVTRDRRVCAPEIEGPSTPPVQMDVDEKITCSWSTIFRQRASIGELGKMMMHRSLQRSASSHSPNFGARQPYFDAEVCMRRKISTLGFLAIISVGSLLAVAQVNREQKVDVGGYGVFTSQAGSGEPIVVFEAGLGEDTSTWDKVLPKVAQFSRTLAYDRAGLGKSDSSPSPKSVEQMVKELHSVLNAARLSTLDPAGHSLGGAVVQLFAHAYPNEVAGLVLVDPEDGRLLDRLKLRLERGVGRS